MLTQDEHRLVETLADVANQFAQVIGDGHTRVADADEVTAIIHCLQDKVLAQAAARLYPEKYRLLGGVVSREGVSV
jgi:hypothetical protein